MGAVLSPEVSLHVIQRAGFAPAFLSSTATSNAPAHGVRARAHGVRAHGVKSCLSLCTGACRAHACRGVSAGGVRSCLLLWVGCRGSSLVFARLCPSWLGGAQYPASHSVARDDHNDAIFRLLVAPMIYENWVIKDTYNRSQFLRARGSHMFPPPGQERRPYLANLKLRYGPSPPIRI
jgi:hypothetical protein